MILNTISYWIQSCSFDEPIFSEADTVCSKHIAPYFEQDKSMTLEEFITTTLKLYKEVQYIRHSLLGDRLNINYITRTQFAVNVMTAWKNKHKERATIVSAICYDLPLE
jgi:hypothetical protein